MEPVAPSTVTARTADAAALLLRNGTALILSPNHKTVANAIDAAAQKTKNCRQNDRGNEAVKAVQQSAMTRDYPAGILYPKAAFYRGFKEITELRGDRQERAKREKWRGSGELESGEAGRDHQACGKAADRAGPGLVRADARPELGTTDAS